MDRPKAALATTRTSLLMGMAMAVLVACGQEAVNHPGVGRPALSVAPLSTTKVAGSSVMPLATPLVRQPDTEGPLGAAVASERGPLPVHIRIAVIGVDAGLGRVGLNPDGTIQAPSDWNQPAWYTEGPAPGVQGPAVIVGHLDSRTGPAVFQRLSELKPGNEVQVTREDGSVLRFRVTKIGSFVRDRFPTDEVYGATPDPALRLMTCGGTFDWSTRRYSDNVVVFAELA